MQETEQSARAQDAALAPAGLLPTRPEPLRLPAAVRSTGWRNAALLGAFVIAATALHVGLVAAYANPIPYSDEWIAIVDNVLRPAANGSLSIWDFFRPHNEHTIAPTRLLALLALSLNHGQFDNVPVALVNAGLYAFAIAVPLLLFFRAGNPAARALAIVLGLAALAPIEAEDLIFGFQNQYYFLIAGSAATLWLVAMAASASKRSLAVFALVAFATCVSMGSGFFCAAIALPICALRLRADPALRPVLLPRLAIAGAITLFGMILLAHSFVVMKDVGILGDKHIDLDGIRRVFSCLAWPYGFGAWLGMLLALPFGAFAIRTVWRPRHADSADYLALALGLWAGAQVCALAFDRHSEATTLASRYLPVLLFWPAMNVYAVLRIAAQLGERRQAGMPAQVLYLLPLVIAGAFISNVAKLVPASLAGMALASQQHVMQAEHMARYVRLGDRNALYGAGHMGLPYADTKKLQTLLDDPNVRPGLPVNVRAPLPLTVAADSSPAFVPHGVYQSVAQRDDLPDFGSYSAAGDAAIGTWRSETLYTDFPFLRLDLAGYLPDSGLGLKLDCPGAAGCRASEVRPADFARESWRGIYVRVPRPQFRLVAEDASPTRWFGFSAPLEVGALSVLADAGVNQLRSEPGWWIALTVGIVCMLLLIGIGAGRPPETARS